MVIVDEKKQLHWPNGHQNKMIPYYWIQSMGFKKYFIRAPLLLYSNIRCIWRWIIYTPCIQDNSFFEKCVCVIVQQILFSSSFYRFSNAPHVYYFSSLFIFQNSIIFYWHAVNISQTYVPIRWKIPCIQMYKINFLYLFLATIVFIYDVIKYSFCKRSKF